MDPLIRQQVMGHKPTLQGGPGMTANNTHTRAETRKEQAECALRRWPGTLAYAAERTEDIESGALPGGGPRPPPRQPPVAIPTSERSRASTNRSDDKRAKPAFAYRAVGWQVVAVVGVEGTARKSPRSPCLLDPMPA